MRKISALVLAVLLLVSVLPMGLLASAETPTSIDGTFESATVGETPDGWTLVPTEIHGSSYSTTNYSKYYLLTVTDSIKNNGAKALCLAANNIHEGDTLDTTHGYTVAQTPAIVVKANGKYVLKFDAKTVLEATTTSNYDVGTVFIVEYDANGDQIRRTTVSPKMSNNADWTSFDIKHKVQPGTATLKVEFYLGGQKNQNKGAKLYIDDFSFAEDTAALDGTFESYTTGTYPEGWTLMAANSNGSYRPDSMYERNYTLTVVESDKYSGSKALAMTSLSGVMNGYAFAQSPFISVSGGKTYNFDFAVKLMNVDRETTKANGTTLIDWFGGKFFVNQYDTNGNLLAHDRPSNNFIDDDIDWEEMSYSIVTLANTAYVELEFFLGGAINQHAGITMLLDDISFKEDVVVFDGTFESYKADELPKGWVLLNSSNTGDYSTANYINNYKVKVVTSDKYSGNKALSFTSNIASNGTYGYIIAQSPAIEVSGNALYKLSYALKLQGVTVGSAINSDIYGGKVWLVQYDENGSQLNRALVGTPVFFDADWQVITDDITTHNDAATVKLEFYLGGRRDWHPGIELLFDDVDFFTCTNHVYDDNCDEDCNICLATREAPHSYDNACDPECNDCGNVREAAHNYDNACDAECNECGDVRVVPHAYDDDCDEECNLCHTPRTVTHDYDGECDEVCNNCGDTRPVNASHTYANDCDTECDVCHATRQPVADHQYTDACDTDCNVCQAPRTAPHDYDSECDTKCNLCEETRTTTVQHDWDAGEVTKPADCKDNGEKTFTCNDCKETKTEEIDKTGHTLGGWTTVQPAGCENGGTEKRECSKCDYEETRETTALGHNFGEPTVTEPTCTNDGIKETACSRCDEKEIEVLEATGHDYGEWEVTKEATETEKGTKTKTCETCGDKKTEDIPKLAPSTDADTDKDDSESAGFPWYYVAIPAAAVLVLVIVIVVIAKSRKK